MNLAQVAVTGGSGVVGTALIRHLVSAGVRPKALSRSLDSDNHLIELGAEPVRGDILEPDTLVSAFQGVNLVFAMAGINTMCPRDPSAMYRVNVSGSLNTVTAARDAGVERIVYTSSAATIGEAHGEIGTEDSQHRGHFLSHYERSKHHAELAVRRAAEGIELIVVNPSSVQGPGRATGTGKLILDLINGKLPALVRTTISIIDIDDCARGHLLAAEEGRPGERYLLNSFTLDIADAVAVVEEVVGMPIRIRYLPGWIAGIGAALVGSGARMLGKKAHVCGEMVRTLRHGHAYDGSKAERQLGLTYSTPDRTLRNLVEWFSSEGLLSRR